jgi:hypothetical protein
MLISAGALAVGVIRLAAQDNSISRSHSAGSARRRRGWRQMSLPKNSYPGIAVARNCPYRTDASASKDATRRHFELRRGLLEAVILEPRTARCVQYVERLEIKPTPEPGSSLCKLLRPACNEMTNSSDNVAARFWHFDFCIEVTGCTRPRRQTLWLR